jgi:hypothetical protein
LIDTNTTQTPLFIIVLIITMANRGDLSDDDDMIIQSMLAAQYAMSSGHSIPGVMIDELFFNGQTSTAAPPVQIDMRGKYNKD